MSINLYVATSATGVENRPEGDLAWSLPEPESGAWRPGRPSDGEILLRTPLGLLGLLDERIWVAEPNGNGQKPSAEGLTTSSARLMRPAPWDVEVAARFALDCAEHILSGQSEAALPDGTSLAQTLADARRILTEMAHDTERRLSTFARISAARRLRRRGELVGDAALAALVATDLEAIDDPVWTTLAAAGDALLAAVEALRHFALPRYVEAREAAIDTHDDSDPAPTPRLFETPWGPIMLGSEHHPAYEPAWVNARDAALRAREAAADRTGPSGEEAERLWQGNRLAELLEETG